MEDKWERPGHIMCITQNLRVYRLTYTNFPGNMTEDEQNPLLARNKHITCLDPVRKNTLPTLITAID
jgi:hypothetical protein